MTEKIDKSRFWGSLIYLQGEAKPKQGSEAEGAPTDAAGDKWISINMRGETELFATKSALINMYY